MEYAVGASESQKELMLRAFYRAQLSQANDTDAFWKRMAAKYPRRWREFERNREVQREQNVKSLVVLSKAAARHGIKV
jgi:hypothetical protein